MPEKTLIIDENPLPQPRPRVTKWGVFDKLREKKLWWKSIIANQFNDVLECPVEVEFRFYLKIPKSTSKKKIAQMIVGEIFHTKKPDIDNLVVGLLNCMTDVVYRDDNQVYKLHAEKKYSLEPRTEILVRWEESGQDKNSENGQ